MINKLITPRRLQIAVALVLSASATVSVKAVDDFDWNVAGSSDWNTATNWNNINIGAGNNDRFINNGGTAEITANTVLPIRDMKIGFGGGTTGTVNHITGLHSTGGSWTFIGNGGGTGTYNVADTTTLAGGITGFAQGSGSEVTGQFRMGEGAGSTATVRVNTTGTIAASGDMFIGTNGGATSVSTMYLESGGVSSAAFIRVGNDSKGTLNISGGSLTAPAGEMWIGQGATGDGTVNQTGGSVSSSDWLAIGRQDATGTYNLGGNGSLAHTGNNHTIIGSINGKGTLNQTGGSFSTTNDLRLGEGPAAEGTYNLSAGTAQVNGWALVGWNGNSKGTLTLSGSGTMTVNNNVEVGGGAGSTGRGTVNLDGGTLFTNNITRNTGAGATAQLNFNGGTFQAMSNQGEFLPSFDTVTSEILTGGAVINSNGFAITTAVALDGVGGLTKLGVGSLTLTAVNTYTGTTSVDNGTLILTGSIATSPLIVVKQPGTLDVSGVGGGFTLVSGQTLAGKGTVAGNADLLAGSKLSPGESAGTLTFTNDLDLSLEVAGLGTASLIFELDTPGTSDLALLTAGILDIGAASLEFDDFVFTALGGFDVGTYTLFDTNSAILGSLGATVSGVIAGNGATVYISGDGQDVLLNVVPEPSAMVSLVGGIAMLVGFQRRRRA